MQKAGELRLYGMPGADAEGFEILISHLLARFLSLPDERIDAEIETAIRVIAQFLGLDQGLLVQWGDDAERPLPTHSWTAPVGEPPPKTPGTRVVPWVHRQSVLGKIVMFSRVDDLPPEAEEDKRFFRASGRKALISLPLKLDGEVAGALVFASLTVEPAWSEEVVHRLSMIADIFASLLDKKKRKNELESRLGFEALLADLSARFVNIAPDEVDGEVKSAQKLVCEHLGLDLSSLWQWSDGAPKRLMLTHLYRALEGPPPPDPAEARELFPWMTEQLIAGKTIAVPSTERVPAEAVRDREVWRKYGIKTSLGIPLSAGRGPVIGILSFDDTRRERDWSAALVARLQLVAGIFANALVRKQLARTLKESGERLNLAADAAGVVLWDLAIDSGNIWVSEGARLLFGWPQDLEMTLETFIDIVYPEDRELLRRVVEDTVKSEEDRSIEYRVTLPDGSVRWILSKGRPYRATREEPVRLLGVSLDITEGRKAEEERLESTERYRAIVEAYDGYIYICGRDNRIEFMSQSLIRRTGRNAVGELCYKALHDLDSVCPWCVNERVFHGETVKWEIQSPKDRHWYYVVNTPIRHADGTFSKQSIIMDITDRKIAEEEIRRAYEEIARLNEQLLTENVYLREEIDRVRQFDEIIGQSDAMKYVFFRIRKVAPTDSTVLVTGETGTGKSLVARAIHEASKRRSKPIVTVNCAALPAGLIESELFGREKGAFTGAHTGQMGRFELADKGTIFLDEIGEMPLDLQAKLLRVIEDGQFERLGSPRTTKVDVRIIASTNRDLSREAEAGRFRKDLFYRLNVFPITIPPLRQRKDDIPLLVKHFVERHSRKTGRQITRISEETMGALGDSSWPGNVRELENIIERAVISSEGPELHLAEPVVTGTPGSSSVAAESLSVVERAHIVKVLKETSGRIEGLKGAARILGLKPSTLRSRMKKLGIDRSEKG